ncbi:histone-lysine N-methyltransferase SMYD3-like [Strongylocentrotus purpuratus]|uniref:SET domain-containing protein n=1 Tax=Strongylocentrotus purpuratus TaxID=7668 RepID=A0A7M7PP98_STRPU|nr:histone-lysine N-methyltransferase SMYD3-like [Strongylocentrotus purpuratus]
MIPPDLAESVQLLSHIIQKQRRSPPCTQDDEDCFPTTVDQLESHHEKLSGQIRRDAFEIWLSLLKDCEDGILPELSSWLKMFGATICNSISICDNDLIDIAVGIYLRASMLNHSCDPNCAWVCDGRKLQIMTVKDVKEGDECTISYVDAMKPAKVRQADLKESYHFTCKCVKCIEEINALGPDDGLGEELRGLKKSLERIKDAEKAQDILLLQLCAPYLKPMDYSSNIPANHHLLYQVRNAAFLACIDSQAWQKAVETGQLNIEPNRYLYKGPYSASLGIYLLRMTRILLELGRLEDAKKYLTETKSVLEVTHGPKHSLMLEVQELFLFLEILRHKDRATERKIEMKQQET